MEHQRVAEIATFAAVATVLMATGCSDGRDDTSLGTVTGASATDAGGDGTDADTGADDGDVRYDVAPGETDGANPEGGCDPEQDPECGCTAVDLLFVIDNSVSMNGYQVSLGQAFPEFADAIIDVLPADVSLHVGVTSTTMADSGVGIGQGCPNSIGDNNQPGSAFYVTPDQQDNGINGAQGRLFVAAGKPYYDVSTSAPPAEVQSLKDWFTEAAHIGESGSQIEMSAAAAGWAADPANAGTNAGFIRDEGAVLVLFFVQDEPDQTPPAAAQDLVARIAASKTKCGGMDCVVGGGLVDESCLPQVALGSLLASMSEPPITATLPSDDDDATPDTYLPVLRDTLAGVIAKKCQEIPPPQG